MSGTHPVPTERWCENCGRQVEKMHRFHKGKGYCSVCYPSEFKPVPCSGCSGTARMHRRDSSEPLCGTCQRARRACVRCGRSVPIAGKIVGDGAVACPSCAPHFRDMEPCWDCGRPSSRLVWAGEGDILTRVCLPCRNKASYATCVYCRRHRISAGATEAGGAFCADCGPFGETWHHCPGCNQVVRGAGNGRCRPCLNRNTLGHEAKLIAVTFSGRWVVQLLEGFVAWLLARDSSNPKLPKILRSHLPFFSALDERFNSEEQVLSQPLLDRFTVAGLRQHELVVRYICDHLHLEITEEEKQEHVESARVAVILQRAQSDGWNDDLFQFNLWLIQAGRPVRTRRLYVSSAASLIRTAGAASLSQLDQNAIERHLEKVPGARTTLSSVIRFANERLGLALRSPAAPGPATGQPKAVARLRALLEKTEAGGEAVMIEDLESIISVALGIPLRAIKAKRWWPEKRIGRWHVVSEGEDLSCPAQLQEIVSRWAAKRTLS